MSLIHRVSGRAAVIAAAGLVAASLAGRPASGGTVYTIALPDRSATSLQLDIDLNSFNAPHVVAPDFNLRLQGDIGKFGISPVDSEPPVSPTWNTAYINPTGLPPDGLPNVPAATTSSSWTTFKIASDLFKIVADFTSGSGGPATLNYYIGSNPAAVHTANTIPAFSSFNSDHFWGQKIYDGTSNAGNTFDSYFDDYSFAADASPTPEPAGLFGAAMVAALLLLCRYRRIARTRVAPVPQETR